MPHFKLVQIFVTQQLRKNTKKLTVLAHATKCVYVNNQNKIDKKQK